MQDRQTLLWSARRVEGRDAAIYGWNIADTHAIRAARNFVELYMFIAVGNFVSVESKVCAKMHGSFDSNIRNEGVSTPIQAVCLAMAVGLDEELNFRRPLDSIK